MTQDLDHLIARANERERKARERSDQLRRIATAEAEIPGVWDTGEVTQNDLVETYGIAPATVKRILRDAGRKITRVRKLSEDDRRQVVALLKANEPIIVLADQFNVSQNTIRRVGLETGVLEKGKRKPRRSDAEYALIEAFDEECRQRFGQGLYNLGIGLKAYHSRQKSKAAALAHANEAKVAATPEPPAHEAPSEAPVDEDGNPIDTQLGGNDNQWPEPAEDLKQWAPVVEPQPVDEDGNPIPTPEPTETSTEGSPEPSPLTEADFRQGFKAPGEPNF